jgi:hypothetical protein
MANSWAHITLWDIEGFGRLAQTGEARESIFQCCYTSDGRYLTYWTYAHIVIRDAETLAEVCRMPVPDRLSKCAPDPAGRLFCAGSEGGAVYLLRVEDL